MGEKRVHAFADDALGEHDAVALAELVRAGQVSGPELAAAAIERARAVDPTLHAVARELSTAHGTRPRRLPACTASRPS